METGKKIFEHFHLKLKIIISVLQKNVGGIFLIKNYILQFFIKISDKMGIILIMLDWLFFFSSRKLVLFLEGNLKIFIFSLSDILNCPGFQGKNSSGLRKLQSGQSNLFLTSFSSALVTRHV